MRATLKITGIGELATPKGRNARRGSEMGCVDVVHDAAILVDVERVVYAGPAADMPPVDGPAPQVLDAGGNAVIPGFVDSHTHFVFGGYRDDEFFWRASGTPYMEIHKRGGGIRKTVRATRGSSLQELTELGANRLDRMLDLGITTVEGKSGYGLDIETELRQLEVMRVLSLRQPVDIVPTYMGAHSIPEEFEARPSDYINFIISEVFPKVRKQGYARFCDIFCEKGVFGLEDSGRYLEAAKALGFGIKIHADEIERSGGAGLAARLGAASADHLLKASPEDLAAMAGAGIVATCLPLTAFSLREPYANGRAMIDSGCAVAIASDFNPGSCFSQSIPLAAALAVLHMGMSIDETLTALTLNGAASLGLAADRGSIEPGKLADIVVLDAPSYRHIAYNIGMNLAHTVVKRGRIVHVRS